MKVELQPGDYVPTRLIKTEDEYQAIVDEFLAAGAWSCGDHGWERYDDPSLAWNLTWDLRDGELWDIPFESQGMLRELTPRDVLGQVDEEVPNE